MLKTLSVVFISIFLCLFLLVVLHIASERSKIGKIRSIFNDIESIKKLDFSAYGDWVTSTYIIEIEYESGSVVLNALSEHDSISIEDFYLMKINNRQVICHSNDKDSSVHAYGIPLINVLKGTELYRHNDIKPILAMGNESNRVFLENLDDGVIYNLKHYSIDANSENPKYIEVLCSIEKL